MPTPLSSLTVFVKGQRRLTEGISLLSLPHTESEFVTCRRGVECQSRIFADHRANKILYSQYYISYIRYKVTIFTMYQLFIIVKTAPAVENNNSPTLEDLEVNTL